MARELSINQYEALDDYTEQLDARAVEQEPACWLTDENDNDMDDEYCLDCVRVVAAEAGNPLNYRVAGYWQESDGCRLCERCGKLLRYTLTDYGVEEELSHFEQWGFDWSDEIQCAEMARVVHGTNDTAHQRRILKILRKGANL